MLRTSSLVVSRSLLPVGLFAALLTGCPKNWDRLYDSLKEGEPRCAPGYELNSSDVCTRQTISSNPELLPGQLGLRTDPGSTEVAKVFTIDNTTCNNNNQWNEQWISDSLTMMKTTSDYPQLLYHVTSTVSRLTQGEIDARCPGGVSGCAWKYASQPYQYLGLPSQSAIDNLPSSLPSNATFHATYALKTIEGSTETVSGRLFRIITTTSGVETWHDDWVLFDEYKLVGSSASTRLIEVTSTGNDPNPTAYGPHSHLRDYLNEMRNDSNYNSVWSYVQVAYTWGTMPASPPTGCPPQ